MSRMSHKPRPCNGSQVSRFASRLSLPEAACWCWPSRCSIGNSTCEFTTPLSFSKKILVITLLGNLRRFFCKLNLHELRLNREKTPGQNATLKRKVYPFTILNDVHRKTVPCFLQMQSLRSNNVNCVQPRICMRRLAVSHGCIGLGRLHPICFIRDSVNSAVGASLNYFRKLPSSVPYFVS